MNPSTFGQYFNSIWYCQTIAFNSTMKIPIEGDKIQGLEIGDAVVIRPLSACGDCPAGQRGHANIRQNLKVFGIDIDGAFRQIRRH
jgi:hypothetical protein